jgi:hypothetical protein
MLPMTSPSTDEVDVGYATAQKIKKRDFFYFFQKRFAVPLDQ